MTGSTGGMPWWRWERAQKRLVQWLRTLIHEQPYDIRFDTGGPSYVDFGERRIVVSPTMPDTFAACAKALPTTWGSSPVVRHSTLQVLCARALAYHEGGHVLFTGTPPVDGPSHAWLLNALEDETHRAADRTALSAGCP